MTIEERAKQLKNLKARKEKLDANIILLEKELDKALELLDIKRKIVTIETPPVYIPMQYPTTFPPNNPFDPITNPFNPNITPGTFFYTDTTTSDNKYYTT